MDRRWLWLVGVLLAIVIPACGPARDPNVDELKIGAYSVVREVLHDGVLPAFGAEWKSRSGREIHFDESYNASGAERGRLSQATTPTWRSFPMKVIWRFWLKPAE